MKIEKSDFSGILSRKIIVKILYIDNSYEKIQALLTNVEGISGIRREGYPKSEKNKGKRKKFSLAIFE